MFWQKQQIDFPAWVSYAKAPIQMREYIECLLLLSAAIIIIIIPYTDLPPYSFQRDSISILSLVDCNNWQSNQDRLFLFCFFLFSFKYEESNTSSLPPKWLVYTVNKWQSLDMNSGFLTPCPFFPQYPYWQYLLLWPMLNNEIIYFAFVLNSANICKQVYTSTIRKEDLSSAWSIYPYISHQIWFFLKHLLYAKTRAWLCGYKKSRKKLT